MGVPLITQVVASTLSPAGSELGLLPDLIPHAVIDAPLEMRPVGVTDIAVPTEPDVPVEPTKLSTGRPAFTVRITDASALIPTEFVATKV